jgi:hypothetical protein
LVGIEKHLVITSDPASRKTRSFMQKKKRREVHEQASKERDLRKLASLLEEIERLLQENKARLRKPTDPTKEG